MPVLHIPFVDFDLSAANRVPASWYNSVQDRYATSINLLDSAIGGDRGGVKDNYAPIMTAIAALGTRGGRIDIPVGQYYISKTINVPNGVHLRGEFASENNVVGTVLNFEKDQTGFILNRTDTIDYTTCPAGTYGPGAAHAILENLGIYSLGYVANAAADGVFRRTVSQVINCHIQGFKRNGLRTVATLGSGGATEGNDNVSRAQKVRVWLNGGDGCYAAGNDSNVGKYEQIDASGNGGRGINDEAAFGNTWDTCHSSGNTLEPYRQTGASGPSVFLDCYSEVSATPSSFTGLAILIGGLHNAGFNAKTTYLLGGAGESTFAGPLKTFQHVLLNNQTDAALYMSSLGSMALPAAGSTDLEQFGIGAGLMGAAGVTAGAQFSIGWNCFYSNGWKSKIADVAQRISFNATSGEVTFWTAPNPGSAEAALVWTARLTVSATAVTIPSLAGTGSRTVVASAAGVITAP